MSESLDFQLRRILLAINELTKNTTIISINAGITASKMPTMEGKVFRVIAEEIRKLSHNSMNELDNLEAVLKDVRNLYNIINVAGRQRMLSQKIMKLKLLINSNHDSDFHYQEEYQKSVRLFEESLQFLGKCSMNSPEVNEALEIGSEIWQQFMQHLKSNELNQAIAINEKLLFQMNEVTKAYESLSG